MKLHGQVLGEQTRFLPGQDLIERIAGGEGTVCVMVTAWGDGETLIEVLDKFWLIRITCFPRRDAAQTQLLGQAILERLNRALDPAFCLRRVGADDLNVQLMHGASKLAHIVLAAHRRLIDPEHAVSVAT